MEYPGEEKGVTGSHTRQQGKGTGWGGAAGGSADFFLSGFSFYLVHI